MIDMAWYGIGGVALLGLTFYLVRRLPSFLFCGAAILAGFIVVSRSRDSDRVSEWYVMTAGLLASFLGLAIVRLMLIRSVSLQLLGRIDGAADGAFQDDVNRRVNEMRVCRLVRSTERGNALTPVGRVAAGVVAAFYRGFGINP